MHGKIKLKRNWSVYQFARLSRGVGWIQHCDVFVFEKFRFRRPHKNAKTEFSKISTLR